VRLSTKPSSNPIIFRSRNSVRSLRWVASAGILVNEFLYAEAVIHHSPGLQRFSPASALGNASIMSRPESGDRRVCSGLGLLIRSVVRAGLSSIALTRWHQPNVSSPLSGRFHSSPCPGLKPWAMICSRLRGKIRQPPGAPSLECAASRPDEHGTSNSADRLDSRFDLGQRFG
jgi:hypothetical protein